MSELMIKIKTSKSLKYVVGAVIVALIATGAITTEEGKQILATIFGAG